MIKEALEYIVGLNKTEIIVPDRNTGISYTDKLLHMVKDPIIDTYKFNTLDGFIDYCNIFIENKIIHIENEKSIKCYSYDIDRFQRRKFIAHCALDRTEYRSGYYEPIEDFILNLKTMYVQTDVISNLVAILGNIVDEDIRTTSDDGISQSITVKKGINLRSQTDLPVFLKLQPYSTFIEIEQPVIEFLLRVKSKTDGIVASLFESKNTLWKIYSVKKICAYVYNRLKEQGLVENYIIVG